MRNSSSGSAVITATGMPSIICSRRAVSASFAASAVATFQTRMARRGSPRPAFGIAWMSRSRVSSPTRMRALCGRREGSDSSLRWCSGCRWKTSMLVPTMASGSTFRMWRIDRSRAMEAGLA